jgi:hypothetical protein
MDMNGNNLLWFFAFLFLMNGNTGFFGGRAPMGPPPATQQDLNDAINNQSIQNQLNTLGIATQNNNLETAKLIMDQNLLNQNQNSTNLINIIQGFNNVVQQMQNQNAQIMQQISQLGYHMDSCCCQLKTMTLENRLADKTAEAVALQNRLDNAQQTQTILGNLGRFVAWAGSGSPTATTGTGV